LSHSIRGNPVGEPVHQQPVEYRLHLAHLRGDVLPQSLVVTEVLRLHAPDDPPSLADKLIELLVGTDVQLAEPLEELAEVLDDAVSKDFRLAILLPREPLGEVRRQQGGQPGGRESVEQMVREAIWFPDYPPYA
jgi:hypothetical protein